MFHLFAKTTKIPKSEFTLLTKELDDHLMKWQLHVIKCNLNNPTPSLEAVRAIERGTHQITPTILESIQRLDSLLQLNGELSTLTKEIAELISRFKASPDGPGFINLLKRVQHLSELLKKLSEKNTTSD